eukprot:CAMPEP_0204352484 /NCGR_PEP_ID=MMETSP0469-20131031/31923_1 /ASSEMBLY_ACC=CAM_ASM_000384 /TAXON_ID=2969 /ORGANISM="Oxyrrhis marina" /LENGTH=40 /DNA_ID= /DNA_START= /DNA_END= /DNA_ORIENTATION=
MSLHSKNLAHAGTGNRGNTMQHGKSDEASRAALRTAGCTP